ncbi:tellurite resistance TerB family protein [Brasilonema sp. UFV-L1]|uniref:tellurite resistance TerB family protein n=1 Tax=Brasilonema sp. UFV-L1 TaxID=2234130 RepID=UPI00145FAD7C|nr:tellurite resistance TerB family protein [Brasilonema sp. UFV-L1]NMG08792.1 hypothetical protein [Brasilonema sp. UFV-L1]
MGKYDKFFNSKKKSEESLSPEEAIAAIAVVTAAADSSLEEVDPEFLADILWGLVDIYEEYSDDELLEKLDKVIAIAEENGVGALFNTARDVLTDELVLDAYAAGVSVLIDEDELRIPKGKTTLLKKLQEAMGIDDEEAQEVMDEVIATFEEVDEDFAEDEDETELEEDSNPNVYESPSGNFIVLIPVEISEGGRIQTQEGSVNFSDDSGTLLRIDYYPISSKQTEEIDSVGQEEYLRSLLLNKYVPQTIVANLPDAQVKHTEYHEDILQGAYFVLVDMPEVSTITKTGNNGTATKSNAYRGLLAFIYDNFLYVVSSQRSFFDGEKPGSLEEEAEGIKQNLLNFVDTIEFT